MTIITTTSYGFDPETEWDLIEKFREAARQEGGWKERAVSTSVVFEKSTWKSVKFGEKK